MITIITGGNGTGKSAWVVQELTRLPKQRKIYVHGIPKLKIAHERIYCRSEHCDMCQEVLNDDTQKDHDRYFVEDWPDWASLGSLIVIDEVQRVWRPRNASAAVPRELAVLETHRKYGLDFWLISQGPHLFDTNIRKLATRHIHLVSGWRGRTEYEWSECRDNVQNRTDSVSRPYKLPKQVFQLYESAQLHTEQIHRKPLSVYAFYAAILVVLALGFNTYRSITTKRVPESQSQAQSQSVESSFDSKTSVSKPLASNDSDSGYPDFTPTVPGVPASAPAYKDLIEVVDVPHVVGCASTPQWCRCYSHQGTPVNVSMGYCVAFLKGEIFNPFRTRRASFSKAGSDVNQGDYKPYQGYESLKSQ